MTVSIASSVPGNTELSLAVCPNNFEGDQVYIRRINKGTNSPSGIVYTQWEAYQLIEAIVGNSGITWEPTAAGTGIIIQAPEDPAMGKRRDDVGLEYFDTYYKYLEEDQQRIVDRVVELEDRLGGL